MTTSNSRCRMLTVLVLLALLGVLDCTSAPDPLAHERRTATTAKGESYCERGQNIRYAR